MKELIQVGRIAAIFIGDKANRFAIYNDPVSSVYNKLFYYTDNETPYITKIPKGFNTILGRALELTEEQKEMCVVEEKVDIENKFGNELLAYPDYENKGCYVLSANESYTSLLEAHQIDNNYILILNNEG